MPPAPSRIATHLKPAESLQTTKNLVAAFGGSLPDGVVAREASSNRTLRFKSVLICTIAFALSAVRY